MFAIVDHLEQIYAILICEDRTPGTWGERHVLLSPQAIPVGTLIRDRDLRAEVVEVVLEISKGREFDFRRPVPKYLQHSCERWIPGGWHYMGCGTCQYINSVWRKTSIGQTLRDMRGRVAL